MRMRWTLLGLVLATMLVMTATAAPSVIAQGAKKTIKLSMVSYKFTPDPPARMMGDFPIITVNRGDTVVFQISNDDPDRRNHSFAARWLMNVQVQARGQFRTGEADERRFFAAQPGEKFELELTFNQVGSFPFVCGVFDHAWRGLGGAINVAVPRQ
jgi:plastocyanin